MKVTKKSIQEKAKEFSNFSADYTIKYKTSKRSYKYYIVKADIYPPESELAYTLKPNQYPIPDKYIVETTYGKNKQTVICYINYIAKRPHYKIIFGLEEEDFISKSTMNGVHLFGLQLKQLRYIREKQKEKKLKPFADLSNRMQVIRNKNMGINLFADFENQIKHNYHSQDDVKLHELTFSVNGSIFHIKYNHFSKELKKLNKLL
ncbi:hypothetical protein F8M41_018715 [Gigaspora margarita]|uniref:Uncharacterized protein n=1 Tax=Gigaspora margarita TaxID=4874 RepID=A0A8H4AL72_GIGMA|nr:hypothetical protein F8M41_018715 [Gigaspora margarita]